MSEFRQTSPEAAVMYPLEEVVLAESTTLGVRASNVER